MFDKVFFFIFVLITNKNNFMPNEKYLIQLEKTIKQKMVLIKNEKLTKKDSNIGYLFKQLKELDEPLYMKLINEYKKI